MSIIPSRQGFACPSCRGFIPTSFSHLISHGGVVCPSCALVLTMNRDDQSTLDEVGSELRRVEQGAAAG